MVPKDHVISNLVWVTESPVILSLYVTHVVPCVVCFLFTTHVSNVVIGWCVSCF